MFCQIVVLGFPILRLVEHIYLGLSYSCSGLVRVSILIDTLYVTLVVIFRENVFMTVFIWQLPCFGFSCAKTTNQHLL